LVLRTMSRKTSAPETISRDRCGQSRSASPFRRRNGSHDLAAAYDLCGMFNGHRLREEKPHLDPGVCRHRVLGLEQQARSADVLDLAFVPFLVTARTIADRHSNGVAVCPLRFEGRNIAAMSTHCSGRLLEKLAPLLCEPGHYERNSKPPRADLAMA